jgi:hypothetical protein
LLKKPSDNGSSPLETSALLALLLLPITPMLSLFQLGLDAIAAESIARHALRYSILWSDQAQLEGVLRDSVRELADSWGREAAYELDCGRCSKGSLVSLRVMVGNAQAIQVAGLEPR